MSLPEGFPQSGTAGTFPKAAWPQHILVILAVAAMAAALIAPDRLEAMLIALALVLAAAASVSILVRTLPLQSVLFATGIIAIIGAAAHGLTTRTGLPLGPLSFGESSGPKLFESVPWTVPLIWVVAIFNSRGVARLFLRPWRKAKNYGFLLLGLTVLLMLAFDLALEPFARANHLWLWQPTKIPVTWYGATPLAFLGWAFVSGIILAIIMPYLIRKQPGNSSSANFGPLVLWLGALVIFGVNTAQAGLWPAVVLDIILATVIAIFCWRGAKW